MLYGSSENHVVKVLEGINDISTLYSFSKIMDEVSFLKKKEKQLLIENRMIEILINKLYPEDFESNFIQAKKLFDDTFYLTKDKLYNSLLNHTSTTQKVVNIRLIPFLLSFEKYEISNSENNDFFLQHLINFEEDYKKYIHLISIKNLKTEPEFFKNINSHYILQDLIDKNIINVKNMKEIVGLMENKESIDFLKEKFKYFLEEKEEVKYFIIYEDLKKNNKLIKNIKEDLKNINILKEDLPVDENGNTIFHFLAYKNINFLNDYAKKNPELLSEKLSIKNKEGMTPVDLLIENRKDNKSISEELFDVVSNVGVSKNNFISIRSEDLRSKNFFFLEKKDKKSRVDYSITDVNNLNFDLSKDLLKDMIISNLYISMALENFNKILKKSNYENLVKKMPLEDLMFMTFFINNIQPVYKDNKIEKLLTAIEKNLSIEEVNLGLEKYYKKYPVSISMGTDKRFNIIQNKDYLTEFVVAHEKNTLRKSLEIDSQREDNVKRKRI